MSSTASDLIRAVREPGPADPPERAGHYSALATLLAYELERVIGREAARARDSAHPEYVPEAVTDAAFASQAEWWKPGDEPVQGVLVPQLIEQVTEAAYKATTAEHDCSGLASIAEIESLRRALALQQDRADFWERRAKPAADAESLVAEWRALDRECTGDGRPWPVGDRMADALSAQIGE
ncbi:hypothetical protein Leucomu_05830 [Leucobacter muris]|uniref:Uncharacterized protein n=1 Tax=Leucobacter muris TaxID=1935379 RepID=A0ABX5QEU8_9MICO|nr:hypothetical protein [Leucobacter muris]QAB17505.1 hypothetical protein Leucomu_05830 [Leucobacter muris]